MKNRYGCNRLCLENEFFYLIQQTRIGGGFIFCNQIQIGQTRDRKPVVAKEISAFYQAFPSYAAVIEKEGLNHPADLHLIGSWQAILDGLAKYAEAGVTDLRIGIAAHDEAAETATREALADHLG